MTKLYIKENGKFLRVYSPEITARMLQNTRTGRDCSKSYVYLLCQMSGRDGGKKLESYKTDAGIVITGRSIKAFNSRFTKSK